MDDDEREVERPLNAVSALTRAGEMALALGDGEIAARAFFDAAWVAARAGEIPTARALYDRGRTVESTPLVETG